MDRGIQEEKGGVEMSLFNSGLLLGFSIGFSCCVFLFMYMRLRFRKEKEAIKPQGTLLMEGKFYDSLSISKKEADK